MRLVVLVVEETELVATEEAGVAVCSFNLGLFPGVANSSVKLETEQALLGETPIVSIISEGFKDE